MANLDQGDPTRWLPCRKKNPWETQILKSKGLKKDQDSETKAFECLVSSYDLFVDGGMFFFDRDSWELKDVETRWACI